ncbi:tetratricopeptide repeat protein [Actomonas aquatica]|uniref:Tetratricopeptide repeat protein n=1 Tax=Actomonas aquatica TaxID=2866162 RepID=A0ABZ1CAA2_9BACT|nr:tetratricopeptide repeat protein [Opitutus sp. WL0086]WRQ87519.1 tetratricopeptide repeat protein [Opitutus sp. WL0086]
MAEDASETPAWRQPLDTIVSARHGGQTSALLTQLKQLDTTYPNVAEISFQIAWTLDSMGRDEQALPHFERAIALGLSPNEQSNALIALAICQRNLGQTAAAAATLESGQAQFPDQAEFDAYLALLRHDQGRHTEALQLALTTLLDTSEDLGITAHQRNLRHFLNQLT